MRFRSSHRRVLGTAAHVAIIGVGAACGSVSGGPGVDSGPAEIDAVAVDASTEPQPVLHWSLDGTTDNAGTLAGFPLVASTPLTYVPGKLGMAAAFGPTPNATVAGVRNLFSTYALVTIGFWMRTPAPMSDQTFFDLYNNRTTPYGGVQVRLRPSAYTCVASSSSAAMCGGFDTPTVNEWHHWILRYTGTGTSMGQGGPVQIFIDGALTYTRNNDPLNNPVFNAGVPDQLVIGMPGAEIDDLRVYDRVFTVAEQCELVMRGTWDGAACNPP